MTTTTIAGQSRSKHGRTDKVLYCIALYCIVLYCIVLYCIVLYCIVLYCTVLYCTVLYCIVLYCIELYYTALYCIDLLTAINLTVMFSYLKRRIVLRSTLHYMHQTGQTG